MICLVWPNPSPLSVGADEDFYKRQEDLKWRDLTDERVKNLTTDTTVIQDRLEDLRFRLKELERIVLAGKDSLRSEYRRHDQDLTRINAVLFQDPTGQKGVLHDVDVLMGRRRDKDETRGLKWQFWGLILTAIIGALAGILPNLDRIKEAIRKVDPLEKKIEQAKHPKSKKKIFRYRVVPEKAALDDTKESPPNPPE